LIQLLQKYCEENAISPESEPAKLETFNRFEVEMFVHAHFCYLISSNMEGIEKYALRSYPLAIRSLRPFLCP